MNITTIMFVIVCGQKIGSCVTRPMVEYSDARQCKADVAALDKTEPTPGIVAYWCEPVKRSKRK